MEGRQVQGNTLQQVCACTLTHREPQGEGVAAVCVRVYACDTPGEGDREVG